MDFKKLKILGFLLKQNKPLGVANFPKDIIDEYSVNGIQKGSIYHELDITMERIEGLITQPFTKQYEISPKGKKAIEKYIADKEGAIMEKLSTYSVNAFVDISPTLSILFPLSVDDEIHEISEKAQEVRLLLNEMVADNIIKLHPTRYGWIGKKGDGVIHWLNNVVIKVAKKREESVPKTTHIDNSVRIGDNFNGIFAQDSSLGDFSNPSIETHNKASEAKPAKTSALERWYWVGGIIAGILALIALFEKLQQLGVFKSLFTK